MRILHYSLGFPPYRTGGMTKFCVDLMTQQAREGHIVALMWPGRMGFVSQKVCVRKRRNVIQKDQTIQNFEVINPLPISFDEGIVDIEAFTKDDGKNAYVKLLDTFIPDVIHIHTLMGLHKSFLEAAKNKNVCLVFTAHDFFPICPKVTMFRQGKICDCVNSCKLCGECNTTALSLTKIKILQSPIYRCLKDSVIVKKIRKNHRDAFLSESQIANVTIKTGVSEDYKKLRDYYYSLLKLMDVIHYNSSITKKMFESVFELPNNCVIPVTHSDVKDNRKKKEFSNDFLRIRYLGPQGGAKGFFLLKAALDELWNIKQNFCLDVHFSPKEMSPYIKAHDRYTYKELEGIFDKTDILVVPSVWYETFGFTVLESLSYAVPVITSGNVGAKDILADGAGIVIEDMDTLKLAQVLQNITSDQLQSMNQIIMEKQQIMKIEDMSKLIEDKCYKRRA